MNAIMLSDDQPQVNAILTWGGSLLLHSILILGSVAFLSEIPTPTPASKVLKWKVSLVKPASSPQPSEPVKTVERSTPITHSTVSRPQPKRQTSQQRRIRQRQPSRHQTAAVSRQTHKLIPQTRPIQSAASPQSSPEHLTQTLTKVSPTQQIASPRQTHHVQSAAAPKNVTHTVQPIQTISKNGTTVSAKSVQLATRSEPAKATAERPVKSTAARMAVAPSLTHLQATQHTRVVHHASSSSTTITQSQPTSTKGISQSLAVPTQQSVKQSVSHEPAPSAHQNLQHVRKQQAMYAGLPTRQTIRKRKQQSKPIPFTQRTAKSRNKAVSRPQTVANQLSPEVLAFLKLVREKIERYRKYPRMAKRLGYHGITTVEFALSQTGDLTSLKIAEPSGHSVLDQAALDAIQKIAPMKPPSMIRDSPIEIPVAFELTR